MDVKSLTTEVWDTVSERQASQLRSVAAEVLNWEGQASQFVCVFMSADGSAHLMCAVPEQSELPSLRSLRGLEIQLLNNFSVVGRERQTYLDMRCTARTFLLPFTRVVQDVATLVLRDNVGPATAVMRVAEAWRAFWSSGDRAPLSEQEQRGLIGELLVLDRLVERQVLAASAWAGPDEDRSDFRTSTAALEVKTCLGLPRRHTINGLDQLDTTLPIPLYLVSVVLDRAEAGPVSLPGLIQEIREKLASSERTIFEDKLSVLGYSPAHDAEYGRNTYLLGEIRAYAVENDFPRLTRQSFVTALPSSIERVNYVVNVEAEPFVDVSVAVDAAASGRR